jgi:elongation factor P hydroxylase
MGVAQSLQAFDSRVLEDVFNGCFLTTERTRLQGGAAEPLYRPAGGAGELHTLFYREDYFASALHEAAHWCIAGPARRRQVDFGYWYAPEGRDPVQQRAFEAVEIKPQALEWIFSLACGYRFQVSVDNLDATTGALPDTREFCRALVSEARRRQYGGLPPRAERFFSALASRFGTGVTLAQLRFESGGLTR